MHFLMSMIHEQVKKLKHTGDTAMDERAFQFYLTES